MEEAYGMYAADDEYANSLAMVMTLMIVITIGMMGLRAFLLVLVLLLFFD